MEKQDLFVSMDAKLKDGQWYDINLPPKFDWKFLDSTLASGRMDHLYYLFHYASILPDESRILEIGTGLSDSTRAMGMAIRGTNSIITTIDPIMLSIEETKMRKEELSKYEFNLGYNRIHEVLNRIKNMNLDGYITPIADTSENVLKRWDGRKIDMLFVDGSHQYEDVKIDCQWMQYIKPGGIAVFDDWIEAVEKAVTEYVSDKPEWEMLTVSTVQPPGKPWKTVYWRNW